MVNSKVRVCKNTSQNCLFFQFMITKSWDSGALGKFCGLCWRSWIMSVKYFLFLICLHCLIYSKLLCAPDSVVSDDAGVALWGPGRDGVHRGGAAWWPIAQRHFCAHSACALGGESRKHCHRNGTLDTVRAAGRLPLHPPHHPVSAAAHPAAAALPSRPSPPEVGGPLGTPLSS